jgi:hypothetical protein
MIWMGFKFGKSQVPFCNRQFWNGKYTNIRCFSFSNSTKNPAANEVNNKAVSGKLHCATK